MGWFRMQDEPWLGVLSYSGKLVKDGVFDARKSAQALLGFDEAVRHFAGEQYPTLREIDYEFPVSIQHSSWDAFIPANIEQWIETGLAIAALKYLTTAATEMAKRDFEGIGLHDIFVRALQAVQWMIRLGKHLGHLRLRNLQNIRWKNSNEVISILNSEGQYLDMPTYYFKLIQSARADLLKKLAILVDDGREMAVGVLIGGSWVSESLGTRSRAVFTGEPMVGTEVLFPELMHGDEVTLIGNVTRGNEQSNSLGFLYKNHVLTCYPAHGSIVRFKHALFDQARMEGIVDRHDEAGGTSANRPKIIFSRVESLPDESALTKLFDET